MGEGFHVTGSACDVSSRAEQEKLMERASATSHGKLEVPNLDVNPFENNGKLKKSFCTSTHYIVLFKEFIVKKRLTLKVFHYGLAITVHQRKPSLWNTHI